MWILWIVGYLIMSLLTGVIFAIGSKDNDDYFALGVASLGWPVTLPTYLCMVIPPAIGWSIMRIVNCFYKRNSICQKINNA